MKGTRLFVGTFKGNLHSQNKYCLKGFKYLTNKICEQLSDAKNKTTNSSETVGMFLRVPGESGISVLLSKKLRIKLLTSSVTD